MSQSLSKIGCKSCGAELVFDPGTQLSNCNFCGSSFEIEQAEEFQLIVPDGILPFTITKDSYEKSVLQWLSDGDFTPDDVLSSTVFQSTNGIYLPMWFFKGRYHGNWSASSGYDRIETYLERDSNGKLRERSRTVTDWRPSNGQISGEFAVLSFANSESNIPWDAINYAHGTSFARGDLKPFDSKYSAGFNLIEFKDESIDSWESYGEEQVNRIAKSDAESRIPGDRFKDLRSDVLHDKEEPIRVYIPFWLTHYSYGEEKFHVYMDGTATHRIEGIRPVDKEKEAEANRKFLKGHIGCGTTILLFLITVFGIESYDSTYDTMIEAVVWLTFITLGLYGIGAYQKNQMIKESKARRSAALEKQLGSSEQETEE